MSIFTDTFEEISGGRFSQLKLSSLEVITEKAAIVVVFICPEGVYDEYIKRLEDITKCVCKTLETRLAVSVKIKKSHFDFSIFTYDMLDFLSRYPAVKHNVSNKSFSLSEEDGKNIVVLKVPKYILQHITEQRIMNEISGYINSQYCEPILLRAEDDGIEDENTIEEETPQLEYDYPGGRVIAVENVEAFFGSIIYDRPGYICDAKIGKDKILCGEISGLEHKISAQKQSPYTRFVLKDFTGTINCSFFYRAKMEDKAKMLHDGLQIVARGDIDLFRDRPSYLVRSISLCRLPQNFVINRAKTPMPKVYKTVFPQPYVSFKQDNVFEADREVPPYLLGKEFIVYDLETTGLAPLRDRIMEIGAVKVKDGKIIESFSTLVDPQRPLDEKITKLTGLRNEDFLNAPTIDEVMPDFYKFCGDRIMVGQNNISFDFPFLKNEAENLHIYFENEQQDVFLFARKYLTNMPNFTLGAITKRLSIVNDEAHRALSDAVATAKAFCRLAEFIK